MLNFTVLNSNHGDDEIDLTVIQFEQIVDYSSLSTGNPIVDESTRSLIEQSFLYFTDNPQASEELAFGADAWHIKVTPNLVRTAAAGSVLIGLLHAAGATQVAALALPVLLPLLIDIDTIHLSVKDDVILSEMSLNMHIKYGNNEPRDIYRLLSNETQQQISYGEFLDVLETLNITGHMKKDEEKGTFYLNENKKFRILFT